MPLTTVALSFLAIIIIAIFFIKPYEKGQAAYRKAAIKKVWGKKPLPPEGSDARALLENEIAAEMNKITVKKPASARWVMLLIIPFIFILARDKSKMMYKDTKLKVKKVNTQPENTYKKPITQPGSNAAASQPAVAVQPRRTHAPVQKSYLTINKDFIPAAGQSYLVLRVYKEWADVVGRMAENVNERAALYNKNCKMSFLGFDGDKMYFALCKEALDSNVDFFNFITQNISFSFPRHNANIGNAIRYGGVRNYDENKLVVTVSEEYSKMLVDSQIKNGNDELKGGRLNSSYYKIKDFKLTRGAKGELVLNIWFNSRKDLDGFYNIGIASNLITQPELFIGGLPDDLSAKISFEPKKEKEVDSGGFVFIDGTEF
ncbi:hypothetical protein AAIR98_001798 [Elusimicrobium simillimum]|uniref:hypothetical protein n=1 Tax=Elusimicrobium simillimum TaxID=3143438 RepID=UPI003C6F097D